MTRALIATALLLLGVPNVQVPGTASRQKESGWISTCDAIGCYGMRWICKTYSTRNASGDSALHYCYEY